MIEHKCLIVFLGNHLTQEQFNDDQQREEILERGVEQINRHCPGLKLLAKLTSFCAASFRDSVDSIERLKNFLDSTQLGAYQEDDFENPCIRTCERR